MPEYEITTFPVLDSGIGIEAGYESDQALREAVKAERAKLSPEVRAAVEEVEKQTLRAILGLDV